MLANRIKNLKQFKNLKDGTKKTLANLEIINPFKKLFKEIEFETLSYCNRKCDYCPNSSWERFGADNNFFMNEKVFITLIQQLKDLGFKGQIAPHLYGEPMSDPRLTKWIQHIRNELKECRIKIVTNGDYLNKESYNKIINAGVDVIFVSKHSKQLKKKCRELLDSLNEEEYKKHIVFNDFYSDFNENQDKLSNRGGDINIKSDNKKPPVNCIYSTYPVINTFGDLIICCQDFHSKYIFGNIMDNHLSDIWYDKNNLSLRKRIFKSKFDLQICQTCVM